MPPKISDKLSTEQLEWVRQWIAGGAPWPDGDRAMAIANDKWGNNDDGVTVSTSGGTTKVWTDRKYKPEDLWAYQPIRRYSVPAVKAMVSSSASLG